LHPRLGKEATSEIKAVYRKEPATAADGAILLTEKLWPALAHVDTSSGALGTAVNKTVHALIATTPDDAGADRPFDRQRGNRPVRAQAVESAVRLGATPLIEPCRAPETFMDSFSLLVFNGK
jgi:hypothetical protein